MILSEIQLIQNDTESPLTITELYDLEQYTVINGYVAMKITGITNSYDSSNPIVCGSFKNATKLVPIVTSEPT